MMDKHLEIGKMINKRGLKSELQVGHYCDSPFCCDQVQENKPGRNGRV